MNKIQWAQQYSRNQEQQQQQRQKERKASNEVYQGQLHMQGHSQSQNAAEKRRINKEGNTDAVDSLKSDIKSTSESHRDINNEQAAKFKKLLGDRQEIVATWTRSLLLRSKPVMRQSNESSSYRNRSKG